MWLLLVLTTQFVMCVTVGPVQYMRTGLGSVVGTTAISVQLLAWVYLLYVIYTVPVKPTPVKVNPAADASAKNEEAKNDEKENKYQNLKADHRKAIDLSMIMFTSVLILATCTYASDAVSLISCAAGDTAFCHSAYLFGDAFFLAWLMINLIIQVITVPILKYWSAHPDGSSETEPSMTNVRTRTLLFVAATAIGVTLLAYMMPMFYSRHATVELLMALSVGITVVILLWLSVAKHVKVTGGVLAIQGVVAAGQFVLFWVRIYYLAHCRSTSETAVCWYKLPQVDVVMICANLVVVFFLGATLVFTYIIRKNERENHTD